MINYFNKLSEDQDKRRVSAKAKAVEIFKKGKDNFNQQIPSYIPPPVQNFPSSFQSQIHKPSPY